jgi:hypothetical protein
MMISPLGWSMCLHDFMIFMLTCYTLSSNRHHHECRAGAPAGRLAGRISHRCPVSTDRHNETTVSNPLYSRNHHSLRPRLVPPPHGATRTLLHPLGGPALPDRKHRHRHPARTRCQCLELFANVYDSACAGVRSGGNRCISSTRHSASRSERVSRSRVVGIFTGDRSPSSHQHCRTPRTTSPSSSHHLSARFESAASQCDHPRRHQHPIDSSQIRHSADPRNGSREPTRPIHLRDPGRSAQSETPRLARDESMGPRLNRGRHLHPASHRPVTQRKRMEEMDQSAAKGHTCHPETRW